MSRWPGGPREASPISQQLDWGSLGPLRLRARTVADGVYAGGHRSARRGAGVEFGGHRPYVPGDDLRWLDHRAYLRHGRLLVREFETETDRTLRLIVDASRSMGFRSARAPGAKLAYAALLAAVLARLALAGGDPVALDWLGGAKCPPLPSRGGREAFERVVAALEGVVPAGNLASDLAAIDRSLAPVARQVRRGSIIVLLSDLLDLPDALLDRFASLGTRGRILVAVQVLDPLERSFDFSGPVRLRASEGELVVETEASSVRDRYLEALAALARRYDQRLVARGGHLVEVTTTDDPIAVVRSLLTALRGGAP